VDYVNQPKALASYDTYQTFTNNNNMHVKKIRTRVAVNVVKCADEYRATLRSRNQVREVFYLTTLSIAKLVADKRKVGMEHCSL
jgi:hypothetical protein